ncbi:hypothetical protein BHE74_00018239 [Ensete ventricosum]|nr:hypothetical protein BHE74_00018239 [Ensete ventricosum]
MFHGELLYMGVVDGLHPLLTHPLAHVSIEATVIELGVKVGAQAKVVRLGKPTLGVDQVIQHEGPRELLLLLAKEGGQLLPSGKVSGAGVDGVVVEDDGAGPCAPMPSRCSTGC